MNTTKFVFNNIINLSSILGKNMIQDSLEEAFKNIGLKLLTGLVNSSYYIFIIYGMGGYILYKFGYEKTKNAPTIAIGAYLIVRIIGGALIGK